MRHLERLRSEQAFHDEQASRRAADLGEEQLRFRDEDYLDHESWIRPALAMLGNVRDRRILDFGCGHGMAAVVLARQGARVVASDLSGGYLAEAQRRAAVNTVQIEFVQANGEELPFADGTFAAIWGNAILHHLDLRKAAPELHRVLAPGGVAVFCEPWGENPLLAWARRRWSYPGKERTPDEMPLCSRQLSPLRKFFPELEIRGQQLLSMASRLLRRETGRRGLARCDRLLLRCFPRLERYCRYAIVTLRRDGSIRDADAKLTQIASTLFPPE
jgi:SAM-dependent methyltransferase